MPSVNKLTHTFIFLIALVPIQWAHAVSGTTVTSFKVSANGAAVYSIPIQTPPGVNGLQPELTLQYNSQRGNGLQGMGWTLRGLGAVRRCGKNVADDDVRGGIRFSDNIFCLNGQRLIKTGSGTDSEGSYREYRTVMDGFARIRGYGSSETSPSHFIVWRKDGGKQIFGKTVDARFQPVTGKTLAWALNQVEQRGGPNNTLTITYGGGGGEHYPVAIDYGATGAATRSIQLSYETRTDTLTRYIDGVAIKTHKRLKTIETQYNNVQVRRYTLNYNNENDTGAERSLLVSLKECDGTDDQCYDRSIQVAYRQSAGTGYTAGAPVSLSIPTDSDYARGARRIDLNGDGVLDVVEMSSSTGGTLNYQLLDASGTAQASDSVTITAVDAAQGFNQWNELADIDGDGLVDLFRVAAAGSTDAIVHFGQLGNPSDRTTFSFAAGVTFTGVVTGGCSSFRFCNQLIDMNGDGLADIFRVDKGHPQTDTRTINVNGTSITETGTGYPYFQIVYGKDTAGTFNFDSANAYVSYDHAIKMEIYYDYPSSAYQWGFRRVNQLADLNGDGLVDIFRVTNRLNGDIRSLLADSDPSNSKRFYEATQQNGMISGQKFMAQYSEYLNYDNQLLDVNGDGVVDIVIAENYTDCSETANLQPYGTVALKKTKYSGNINVRLGKGDGTFGGAIPTLNVIDTSGFAGYIAGEYDPPGASNDLECAAMTAIPKVDSAQSVKGISHWNQFADMDGDGKVDIVRVDPASGAVPIAYGKGDGTFKPPVAAGLTASVSGNGFRAWNTLADLNGDGMTDLFTVSGSNGTPYHNDRVRPAVAEAFSNGYGLETRVGYTTLKDNTVYSEEAAAADGYPLRKVRPALTVVSNYQVSDPALTGLDSYTYRYAFQYRDARSDLTRGWLGFGAVIRKDLVRGLETRTDYRQDYPYTGRPARVSTRLSAALTGQNLQVTTYTWGKRTTLGVAGSHHFVYPILRREERYEPNDNYALVHWRETRQEDTSGDSDPYDTYGNPERIVEAYNDGQTLTTVYIPVYDGAALYPGQHQTLTTTVSHHTGAASATRVNIETYDNLGRRTRLEAQAGSGPQDLPRVTTTSYDAYGLITGETVSGWDGGYDSNGNRLAASDSSRGVTYAYLNLSTRNWQRTRTVNVGGSAQTETTTYDGHFGVVSEQTDVRGQKTQWDYDALGRRTVERRYAGTAQELTTTITYSATCGITTCRAGAREIVTTQPPDGGPATTQYDALGREIRTVTQGAAGENLYSDTDYDTAGRIAARSLPDASAAPARWVRYQYDAQGRIERTDQPNGLVITQSYSGLSTTVTRTGNGEPAQQTIYQRDSQDRIIQIQDALGGITTYNYAPFGQLSGITDARGNNFAWGYDNRGNRLSQDDPDLGLWTYRYNAFGELKWQKDAKGQIISYQYDVLGRLTQRDEIDSAGSLLDTTQWTYDNPAKGLGLLDTITRAGVSETYGYDAVGRQTSVATTVNGVTYTATTTYDNDTGRILNVAYPDGGPTVHYTYHANGALKALQNQASGNTYWQADSYNALGLITAEQWGNGITGTRGYDPASGRLTAIQTGTGNAIQDLSYSYLPSGNLASRYNGRANRKEYFRYDALDRLLSVTGNDSQLATVRYEYDAIGNLTYKTGLGQLSYGAAGAGPHAVTATGGANPYNTGDVTATLEHILGQGTQGKECDGNTGITVIDILCINRRLADGNGTANSYGYDANGNLVVGGGRSMTYTLFNQPATVTRGGATTSYSYGPGWQRLTKSENGVTTTYIGKLYERAESSGGITRHYYLHAAGRLVAQIETDPTGATRTDYVHTDLLGSVDILTDAGGAIVEEKSFTEYGDPRMADWTSGAPAFARTTRGYTGHETDTGTGLIHMNARLYDPQLGRFLRPDPTIPDLYNPQALNRYSYVLNNPFRYVDPTGYAAEGLFEGFFNALGEFLFGGENSDSAAFLDSSEPFLDDPFSDTSNFYSESDDYTGVGDETGGARNLFVKTDVFDLESDLLFSYFLDGGDVSGDIYVRSDVYYGRDLAPEEEIYLVDSIGVEPYYGAESLLPVGRVTEASAAIVFSITSKVPKGVHKNSLDYVGETHVYRIKGPNGTNKIGESAQGTRVRDGASIRAEQQARQLRKETGQPYRTDIRKTFPDKRSAREYETRLIERFRRRYGQDALPGNKANR